MFIIKYKKFFVGLSAFLVLASLVLIFTKGIRYGIEFSGGSIMEVQYSNVPDNDKIIDAVSGIVKDDEVIVQKFGENGVVIRTRDLSEEERLSVVSALEALATGNEQLDNTKNEEVVSDGTTSQTKAEEATQTDVSALATTDGQIPTFIVERFNSIGPSIGKELREKALIALIIVLLAIILFVAYAFRKVSKPVSSWKYGLIAVLALIHDVLIPVGIFILLGLEADSLFVVGILSILGLSVNDTIVVFDRIRENLHINQIETIHEDFSKTVGKSITQTVSRSLSTSFTLLVVLVMLYFVGPNSTQSLALVMIAGTIFGTYSSVFLASPLLVMFADKKNK